MIGAVHDNNLHNLVQITGDLLNDAKNHYRLNFPYSQLAKYYDYVTLGKELECLAKEKVDERAGLITARYIDTHKKLIEKEYALGL
jgi:hypothetical protein